MRIVINNESIDIQKEVNTLISYLQKKKIMEGSIICIRLADNLKIITLWMACKMLGYIPLFLPIYFDNSIIEYILKNVKVNYFIDENKIIQLSKKTVNLKYNLKQGCIIHTTSATEGMPKLIVRTWEQIQHEMIRYIKAMNLSKSDVIMPILPLYHSYGFLCGFMPAYFLDATLVLSREQFPKKIARLINENRVTVMLSVPQVYNGLLQSHHETLGGSIKYYISSSAHLSESLANDFYQKYGIKLTQLLGCSETGCLAFSSSQKGINIFDYIFESVYFKLDEQGQLFVNSDETIGNYIRNHNIIELKGKPFCMGEKAEIDQNGYIKIQGRFDKVLNLAGRKVSALYLKEKLMKYMGLSDIKIITVERENVNKLEFYIMINEKYRKDDFISFIKSNLEPWLYPQKIICVENLNTWKE